MFSEEVLKLMLSAIRVSVRAGEKMLAVYNSDFAVERKEDSSPLTLADQKSHETIVEELVKFNYPILSEEGKHIDTHIKPRH